MGALWSGAPPRRRARYPAPPRSKTDPASRNLDKQLLRIWLPMLVRSANDLVCDAASEFSRWRLMD
jgi:hypothetical protein